VRAKNEKTREVQDYLAGMATAANFAWVNHTMMAIALKDTRALRPKHEKYVFHMCTSTTQEGQDYLAGMAAAANYAWVNRTMMTFLARRAFAKQFGKSAEDLDMHVVYDVSHNIAKVTEKHAFLTKDKRHALLTKDKKHEMTK